MQDKFNEKEAANQEQNENLLPKNQKGLMDDSEMKQTLDSLKETEKPVIHKLDSFETKARLALEDFIEGHPFYKNLKSLGYDIIFCHYDVQGFKKGKKQVEVWFNLVWGDIKDKDFHREKLKISLDF